MPTSKSVTTVAMRSRKSHTSHPIVFNKVTPLSKFLAMVIFITFPFIGFYLGYKYGVHKTIISTEVDPCSLNINTPTTSFESQAVELVKQQKDKTVKQMDPTD